jgi:hypothetical protein
MKIARSLRIALVGAGLVVALPLAAETLVIDGQVAVASSNVPTPPRGSTMADVERNFGAPMVKRDSVGNPPITKWEYANFVVVFENDRVLHAVVGRI